MDKKIVYNPFLIESTESIFNCPHLLEELHICAFACRGSILGAGMSTEEKCAVETHNDVNDRRINITLGSHPPSSKSKNVNIIKEKTKRIITQTDCWDFTKEQLLSENQYNILLQIRENNTEKHFKKIALQQINKKISGYKSQDIEKKLFDPNKLIDLSGVLQKMTDSDLKCFYCHKQTVILYENVREPMQWTLERLDNKYGHNTENVEIACLSCNLKRRTMYHERFMFTKNLNIIKMDSSSNF